jgi:hypothetical protein
MENEEEEYVDVFKLSDLIENGEIDERIITVDTHHPKKNNIIHLYDYHPAGYDPVVFKLDESQLRKEAVNLIFQDDSSIILYLGDEPLTEEKKEMLVDQTNLPKIEAPDKIYVDLSSAREEVSKLNHILQCVNFRITVNFVYDINNDDTIYSYWFNNMNDIILCLYEGNVCVSSIMLSNVSSNVVIASRTSHTHEKNNLNKLLRAAAILVSHKINPSLRGIESNAINPTSLLLLVKYFNGELHLTKREITEEELEMSQWVNEDPDVFDFRIPIESIIPKDNKLLTHEIAKKIINAPHVEEVKVVIEFDEEHLALAEQVFIETAQKVRCVRRSGESSSSRGNRKKPRVMKTKRRRNLTSKKGKTKGRN